MIDPTRENMLDVLDEVDETADRMDREQAMYWFAADYHSGQGSNLYAALSTSPYRPAPMERGCDTFTSEFLYSELVGEFA